MIFEPLMVARISRAINFHWGGVRSLVGAPLFAQPLAQQVRCRHFLFPMATKGFKASRFEFEGQALQFARESKRIPIWKLSWAANISVNFLLMVERGDARLPPQQRRELERLLGVPLKRETRSRIDRMP